MAEERWTSPTKALKSHWKPSTSYKHVLVVANTKHHAAKPVLKASDGFLAPLGDYADEK